MPPIDRNAFVYDDVFKATLASLLAGAQAIAMPDMAREALARVTAADDSKREAIARTILADGAEVEFLADHVFVAAAVQVHFARLAAQLDPEKLVPVGDGACPTCGGAPAASVLVTWPQAHGTRFCACAHCGTMWNYVRIKCTLCGSTKGIAYQEIDGGNGAVKAETCEECGGYVKILNQAKDPGVEPIADDVASLGLDMLVHELGHRRGAFNPFLLGY
jgi:FdhE protein